MPLDSRNNSTGLLREFRAGMPVSASKLNDLVRAINKWIKGARPPRQITPKDKPVAATIDLCILREVNLDNPKRIMVQKIRYSDGALLEGEDYKHIEAYGDIIEAFPLPTFAYAMYDIQGAVRPVSAIVPGIPENLSAAVPFLLDGRKWLWPVMKFTPSMRMANPNVSTTGGGGA